MRVVGLDLSLTATGVYSSDGGKVLSVVLPPKASDLERTKRLHRLSVLIDRVTRGADIVVMEGHSFSSANTHAHSLGELHGVVKVCLLQRCIPFAVISPSEMKKFATGRGNASKDQVFAEAVRMNHAINSNDVADAYWLYLMGLAHYEQRDVIAPKFRQVVLQGITRWPAIEEKEEVVA